MCNGQCRTLSSDAVATVYFIHKQLRWSGLVLLLMHLEIYHIFYDIVQYKSGHLITITTDNQGNNFLFSNVSKMGKVKIKKLKSSHFL